MQSAAITPSEEANLNVPYSQLLNELTAAEKENLAYYVLQRGYDNTRRLSGGERGVIAIIAGIIATSTASSSKEFGDEFMQGFEGLTGVAAAGSEWAIAVPAFFAQLSLPSNAIFTVLTKLLRHSQRAANPIADKYEKPLSLKEKAVLALIPLGSLSAWKIGFDAADHYGWSEAVSQTAGALRFAGMLGVNYNYTSEQTKSWWRKNDYERPIVCALASAKNHLKILAEKADAAEFLQFLNAGGLLKKMSHLNEEGVSQEHFKQLESIVDALSESADVNAVHSDKQKGNWMIYLNWTIGILSTLTKLKAGSMVPDLFGVKVPKDWVEFFKNIRSSSDMFIVATVIGCVFFGMPAWFLNAMVTSKSCFNFLAGDSIFDNRNLKAPAALVGIGYGLGYAGAGFKYNPAAIMPIPTLNMLFSGIGYSLVGYVSMKKCVNRIRYEWWERSVLDNALAADDLLAYYQSLSADKRPVLVRLLLNHVTTVLDAQLECFNQLDAEAVNLMFSPALQKKLDQKFKTDLREVVVQATEPADLVSIKVDTVDEIDQRIGARLA
jgi:hypothetical protein